MDVGLSVSRVGGKAQLAPLKEVAGQVRLDYAQYLELRMFSRFGGFGDPSVRRRIAHGDRIGALLSQPRFAPLRSIDQIALLSALGEGLLEEIELDRIPQLKSLLPGIIDSESRLADIVAHPDKLNEDQREALLDCARLAISKLDPETS